MSENGAFSPFLESGSEYALTMMDFATRNPDAIGLNVIDLVKVAEGMLAHTCQGFSRQTAHVSSVYLCNIASVLCRELNP